MRRWATPLSFSRHGPGAGVDAHVTAGGSAGHWIPRLQNQVEGMLMADKKRGDKKKRSGKKRGGPRVDRLHFAGSDEKPDRHDDLISRRPILGSGKTPAALVEMQKNRRVYVTGSGNRKPEIGIKRVAEANTPVWQVELPVTGEGRGGEPGFVPGIAAERTGHEAILAGIDPGISVAGHRPAWQDALYQPRLTVQKQFPPLQRFDGRPVDPLVVFGADDRWSFKDSAWPWGLVGKIFTSSGWTGSGVLVGERLVVTAAHVVPWADAAAGSWWMKFVPAYYDGSSLYGAGVESYVSNAKGMVNVSNVVGYDWAILRLYNPLGSSLGYFGFNGYSSDWNDLNVWSGIGYPGAIASGQRPAYQGGYSIIDVDSDSNGGKEIESRSADLTSGNSGGPIFAWWGGDPRIVGVVSGAEQEYWFPFSIKWVNVFAGGSGFTNLIWWGRTNWPA